MIIVWFKNDLRLNDNTALIEAMKTNQPLMCVFQINHPQLLEDSKSQDYFFQSVQSFNNNLTQINQPLHFIAGDTEESFDQLLAEFPDATAIYTNISERGYGLKRDHLIQKVAQNHQIAFHGFMDHHLIGAHELLKKDETPFKVFTPYYNQWKKLTKPPFQKTDLAKFQELAIQKQESELFKQGKQKFQQLIEQAHQFDNIDLKKVRQSYDDFIDNRLDDYPKDRDFPALNGTSDLSKDLTTGLISIREVYWRLVQHAPESDAKQAFIRQLCWRDFYNMVYAFNPEANDLEIKSEYRNIKWRYSEEDFNKWKNGETGYPLVDAAMRHFKATGELHNRLRMVVASFLTKDLLIDWRWGEKYFSEQLIDYDSASNIGGWQWASSTGTDAAPYFRIFNPTTQSERFDPQGKFIRQYLPELGSLSNKDIHKPTENQRKDLNYPQEIVDHKFARQRALDAFKG
ncbi:deoxyribodipyrimidine photo-lyase [Holzapfeliella sp. He02]|uniref:Deoxyribodipyrimidine photo-lyase n=1 Tax=Holzapfeliella saturejae TaxID=3082953 RepID=A0ABU8SF04_9LACO